VEIKSSSHILGLLLLLVGGGLFELDLLRQLALQPLDRLAAYFVEDGDLFIVAVGVEEVQLGPRLLVEA